MGTSGVKRAACASLVVVCAFLAADYAGVLGKRGKFDVTARAFDLLSERYKRICEVLLYSGIADTVDGESDGVDASSSPERVENLARRRYQRGALRLEGNHWILRWREDLIGDDGLVRRPEKRARVGSIEEYPTKRLARRAADRIIEPLNAPEYRPGRVATVSQFAEVYKRDGLTGHKRTARKAALYHLDAYIIPTIGDVRLDELGGPVAQRVVNAGIAAKISRKTILNVLGTLRAMIKRAKSWDYRSNSFAYSDVTLPPETIREEARAWTPEESLALIDAAPSLKWKTCFALMAYLGLRCGEALGVAWDHVDLDARVLRVRQAVVEGEIQTVKSKTSRRDLPIPEDLARMLEAYRLEWRENAFGLLFVNRRRKPYHANRVREFVFCPLRDRLGLSDGAFHAFRHGNATTQLQAGASIVTVKENLGHAKIETTLRYTHAVSGDQREAVDRVAAVFSRARAANDAELGLKKGAVGSSRRFAVIDGGKVLKIKG